MANEGTSSSLHPPGVVVTSDFVATPEPLGKLVAERYRILQKLGEGGFGIVYLAEQRVPVQRQVALKIIKPGMDTAQVIGRFEQERQTLALMDHPHIAKVLDGGTTETGHPFFVMELVRGLPITRFCNEHRLTLQDRLTLFIPVCQAIQHAHQKGIIHRDIKPSNVLVMLQDGKPVPKVIDFGVAKALHQRLTDRTMFTQIGTLVGTPEYVSPEQAGVDAMDIDTRSDIYSLGIVLYELLTGVTPVDGKRLRAAAYDEVLRIIREEEPPAPSTRITSLVELPSIAAQRQLEPRKLRQFLRGDLDWIVMRAVEKDRNRRYETANGLALDLQRFLNDEPVLAGPPSTAYRVKKFLKRNRGPVAATAVLLALLVLGTIGTAIGLVRAVSAERRAEQERDRAEENLRQARHVIDEFYVQFSKRLADTPGAQPIRKELLESGLKFYQQFLEQHGDNPDLRADTAMTYWRIARIRQDLGDLPQALADYRKGMEIQEKLVAEHPTVVKYREDLAATCNNMSGLVARLGDRPEGIRLVQRAIELRGQAVKELPDDLSTLSDYAGAWNNLGVIYEDDGQSAKAMEAQKKALEIRADLARRKPDKHEFIHELGMSHNNLGAWHWRTRDDATAQHHYEQALAIRERLNKQYPKTHGFMEELAKTHHNLALLHNRQKRPTEALRHNEAARDLCQELMLGNPAVPAYRRSLSDAFRGMGITLHGLGRLEESWAAFQRCFELRSALVEQYPTEALYLRELAQAASNFGAICQKLKRTKDALVPAERAVRVYETLLKASPTDDELRSSYAQACTNLGAIRTELGRPAPALEALDKAFVAYQALLQKKSEDDDLLDEMAGAWNNRAMAYDKLERWEESLAACAEAVQLLKRLHAKNPTSPAFRGQLSENYLDMAKAHRRLGRPAKAAELALECQALAAKQPLELYNVACELAQCVPLVGKDPAKLSSEEQAERQRYADAAMKALHEAVQHGYKDGVHMEKDADLTSLRERADFKQLIARLKQGSEEPKP